MAGNLLSIGKSGLFAAQVGLSTTGHNIANANVAGYSRQVVVQASATPQDMGYGFVGSGTQVTDIKRYSDNFLNIQVRNAQASKSSLDSYYAQIKQIDNLLADPTAGLSPALQDFFKGVQDLASNPGSTASRQSLLSGAESLASRFQGIDGRMQEIRDGVNGQIGASVTLINSYAQEIARLNEQIGNFSTADNRKPNDLLDARDQLVADLNKQVKATVTPGDNNSLTVSIGNGMPLVVGKRAFSLDVTTASTDQMRVEVGYVTGNKVTVLGENSLTGGELGGLLEFRSGALDRAQNSLGRIALNVASSVNAQHRLGVDAAGNPGGDFFTMAEPVVGKSSTNAATSTTDVKAAIVDAGALTQSDYKVEYTGSKYMVRRLSDNKTTDLVFPQTSGPQVVDGIAFSVTGNAAAGDFFTVRPTINGASGFNLAISDRAAIAAGAPIVTDTPLGNTGTAKISQGSVDSDYLGAGSARASLPLNLTFNSATGMAGFPAGMEVVVDNNGSKTSYTAGSATIPFVTGASYSFGGISVSFSGAPGEGDSFQIGVNGTGSADNRNARLLGNLQTANIMDGGKATLQTAYAEMVSFVGNKTREVQVNAQAGDALLAQVRGAQQDVSGVNLDEEATNLVKYQQAYQAAGKVMQIASTLFDTLLSLGR